jgi:enoyl-CoA hydratase
MPEAESHILFEKKGALGLITLNRPRALNALTHGMCLGMFKALREWAADDGVKAVAIRGAGPRAFCAGGDIRAMAESNRDKTRAAADFLRDEYRLNALIGGYAKPYVALTHGVVMGGGAGVSVHGHYRLGDADLAFAMPETGIGFMPDIGSSFFLSRCPGEAGLYLALTGARIDLGDALMLGLMTHSVAAAAHDDILARLMEGEAVSDAIAAHARPRPASPLAQHMGRIETIFAAASVEAVLERLDRDGSAFAADTARLIRTRSPTALKLAFALLRRGKTLTLNECLKMEYRAAVRMVMGEDFREGVRAQLLDKDGKPRWQPDSLVRVKDADLADYFAPLGARELALAENARG